MSNIVVQCWIVSCCRRRERRSSIVLLLENCADGDVTGVGGEVQFGVGSRKGEQRGVGKGVFGVVEGGVGVGVPGESFRFALEEFVEWCQDGSDMWKEAVVKGNQPRNSCRPLTVECLGNLRMASTFS